MKLSLKKLSFLALSLMLFSSCLSTEPKETKETKEEVKETPPARVSTPQPSPLSKLEQKVGLTDVIVEYSRPGMKGRKIFGGLEDFGKVWRTGANANTKVTFSDDVSIDGKSLSSGTYALYTIPNKDSWDVMFYSKSDNWGVPRDWDESKVALKTTIKPESMPMSIETFTITIDDITNNSAVIGILWENTYVGVPFNVPTDAAVMASIEEVMKGEPNDRAYYDAAVYFKTEGKDINQALAWIDKAVEMTQEEPKFWYLRQQSLIHAKAGKKETAIAAAKKSMSLAEEAGNQNYVKMNKESLKEWGAK